MASIPVTKALAALGHPGRLAVFRLLMRFAPQGVRPTEMAEALGFKQNTLSNHLSELETAGLIQAERRGRSVFYCVRLEQVSDLIGYLVNDAGRGRPDVSWALLRTERRGPRDQFWNVLFICSGNSARSIFAEAILRDAGKGRFEAFSAGTRPALQVNPHVIEVLAQARLDVSGLRSKHLSEFARPGAPVMDFVFTVCDTAAAEDCAPWPGQPMTAHWGIPDPVKASGDGAQTFLAFGRAFSDLQRRITAFTKLPVADLADIALQHHLDTIGLS